MSTSLRAATQWSAPRPSTLSSPSMAAGVQGERRVCKPPSGGQLSFGMMRPVPVIWVSGEREMPRASGAVFAKAERGSLSCENLRQRALPCGARARPQINAKSGRSDQPTPSSPYHPQRPLPSVTKRQILSTKHGAWSLGTRWLAPPTICPL